YSEDSYPGSKDLFFTWLPGEWAPSAEIHKEIWTAQEDLWIQKELFRLIAQANDYVATFTKYNEGDASNPKYYWVNPYWRLDLKLPVGGPLTLKMKNLL